MNLAVKKAKLNSNVVKCNTRHVVLYVYQLSEMKTVNNEVEGINMNNR